MSPHNGQLTSLRILTSRKSISRASIKSNFPIKGLHKISNSVSVFHSGTDFDSNGNYITNGGRVITLVVTSNSLESSRLECYENISNIEFENMYYRKDIGKVLRSFDK